MSIVSFKNRFVFIKTRKTAGTSIQESLLPICGMNDIVTSEWTNLITGNLCLIEEFASMQEIITIYGINPKEYFSFGFTRNPFSITLSRYFYQVRMGRIPSPATREDFNRWVAQVYFIGEAGFPGGRFIKDRSRYLLFDSEFMPVVNYIGKFETLETDFLHILREIGYPKINLEHVNKSNYSNISYKDWLDPENVKKVRHFFDLELEYFGYTY